MATLKASRIPAWKCPSCTKNSRSLVSFSTSTTSRQINPESPKYIDFPEPPQQQKPSKKTVRGFLPVPRDLFKPNRGGTSRVTRKTLAAATQSPHKPLGSTSQKQARLNEWRNRMTDLRKTNLREGLMSLKIRREKETAYVAMRQAKKIEERQNLDNVTERENERLTNPSITALLKDRHAGLLPDPGREARLEAMRARVAAKEADRARARQDALHTLYMRARHFIVNEEQLNDEVDKVFGTAEDPVEFGSGAPSIWYEGKPPTLRSLLANASGVKSGYNEMDAPSRMWRQRLEKVTGDLTGGKL